MKPLAYATIEVRLNASGVSTRLWALRSTRTPRFQDFTFTAHDLLSVTGSNHSSRSYSRPGDHHQRCPPLFHDRIRPHLFSREIRMTLTRFNQVQMRSGATGIVDI